MNRGQVTVFRAASVVTLDSAMPVATAVAVQDGRVLHTGEFGEVLEDLAHLAPVVDDSFGDRVIIPGFVEGHTHILEEGAISRFPWIGSYDRRMPAGGVQPGCPDHASAVARIARAHAESPDHSAVVTCLGWDPNLANSPGITRDTLDAISSTRPIFVLQSNGHVGHANTAMLALAGITRDSSEHGIVRDGNGEPTGDLREMALARVLGPHVQLDAGGRQTAMDASLLARRVGCTTVTDLAFAATENAVVEYAGFASDDEFAVRVVYAPLVQVLDIIMKTGVLEHVNSLRAHDSDNFRMGPVKFVIDGSIQGRTARLNWPGYCCGSPNGEWLLEPDEMFEAMLPYHRAGHQLALHTNGDEAIDRGLDVFTRLLNTHPRVDHRHRLEHVQMATDEAFMRMRALGMAANLFSNHVYYWGETHRRDTMGPAKARRIDAAGTAHRLGIPYSLHSDAPVTPVDPLFTMWCAVNRVTSAGNVLGENERITPLDALRAMTISSAWMLHLDREVGSIEVGKRADFAVLSDDPTKIEPMALRDIDVVGTVLGGTPHVD